MEKKRSLNLFFNGRHQTKKMLKGIIVFVFCFSAWVSFAEAEHLNVASQGRIQKRASMSWRDFDLRDVSDFFFQNPTIVDKRNGQTLRSLTEIRSFLYNNFSTKELRADAEREVLEKNNITAALFLGLSAKYILPMTEKDCVMRFLKENLDRLETYAEADASQKEKFRKLQLSLAGYFSSEEEKWASSCLLRFSKMLTLTPDELKGMKKEVLDSTDDTFKFAYLMLRIRHLINSSTPEERLSEEEYSMAVELGRSPEISREAYLSLLAEAEITVHGLSMPAAILLSYNAEVGGPYIRPIALSLGNGKDVGYHSYLMYRLIPYDKGAQHWLVDALYGLLFAREREDAICLLGFLDAYVKKPLVDFPVFKRITPWLLKEREMMTMGAYDAALLRGKEQYARDHVYENEHYESRFRESIRSSIRLEESFVRCFSAWGGGADAEHLDVANGEGVKEGVSMPWRDFDLREVGDFSFQNPTIVDKRNGRALRSLTEIRWFLYNNFSTKELRADAEREVLEKNNITAAWFLGLSAKYILSMTERDRVKRFLKEHIDRLEPHSEADSSQKKIFRELQLSLAVYFSSEKEKWASPSQLRYNKMLTLTPDELKGMKKEVFDSADDTLKIAYLSVRILHLINSSIPEERLSEAEYSMAVELENSPKISREAYLSLRSAVEMKFHGFSMPAVILSNYNFEVGCHYMVAYAVKTALALGNGKDIGYYAYLAYRQSPNDSESAPNYLLVGLAQLLMSEKNEEAICLLGFLDASVEKPLVDFPIFKQIAPLLSQRTSMMTKRAYDAAFLRGKEQYARDHVYENEDHESRFRKSMLSIFRLENLPVDSEKSLSEKPLF